VGGCPEYPRGAPIELCFSKTARSLSAFSQAMERFWVPHEDLGYAPCFFHSSDANGSKYTTEDGQEIVVKAADAANLPKVHDSQLMGVDNVCTLDEVNPQALLYTVRTRYLKKQVYTCVSRIVVAVNPFQSLAIYSSSYLDKYCKASDSAELPPHVYGVGLDAVNGLRKGERNQAVLISGESGAGKTESTKLVLSYVANAISGTGGIEDKILRTNPVLEAFGNAMTVRNNNSSRFGKWLEIAVSRSMQIIGCSVTDYLLEVTRVIEQGSKERNYHVFFQVLEGRKSIPELKELGIQDATHYRYLKTGQEKAPGIDDGQCFEELREAFTTLGFDAAKQTDIYKIIAGILALGNVEYKESGEAAQLVSEEPVQQAAKCLGVDVGDLKKPLLMRKLVVGKEVTETPLKMAQADQARDSLSRMLYGRLFKLLIKRINETLGGSGGDKNVNFGVLDIAGFESFEFNSLEQLFINLSNEHLQMHFNNYVFKMELDDYKSEGIDVGNSITFKDNSDVVALIDAKGGVLSTLDEEVALPKGSDEGFRTKIIKANEKHARFVAPKMGGSTQFGIKHFAGLVTYNAEGFLAKNVDKPPDDAPTLLGSSSNGILKEVAALISEEIAASAPKPGAKKVKTVSSGFRASLADLMQKLSSAEPHFVRCVKPNKEKVPEKFTPQMVAEQLTFSGVMEAIQIRQQGFANRIPFKEWAFRYKVILPMSLRKGIAGLDKAEVGPDAVKALIEKILKTGGKLKDLSMEKDIVLGKSKVFSKAHAVSALEKSRELALAGQLVKIQAVWRGALVRREMKKNKVVLDELKSWFTGKKIYEQKGAQYTALATFGSPEAVEKELKNLSEKLERAEKLPVNVPNGARVRETIQKMEAEVQISKQLKSLQDTLSPVEIQTALARAKDMCFDDTHPDVKALTDREKKLTVQLPLVKAIENALASDNLQQLQEVMDAVKAQQLNTDSDSWASGLKEKGFDKCAEVYEKLQQLKQKQKLDDIEAKRREELNKAVLAKDEVEEKKQGFEVEEEPEKPPEPEKPAAKQRKTITGLDQNGQGKILMAIQAACAEYDVERMEDQLSLATAQGIDKGELEPAQNLLADLQKEEFLSAKIQEMAEKLKEPSPPMRTLKCLQNMITQAQKLNVAQDAVAGAKPAMQSSVQQRIRRTVHGNIFEQVDVEEIALAHGAFDDLSQFKRLKNPTKWKGHRRDGILSRSEKGLQAMMSHNRNEIREALTEVASSQEMLAQQTYRDVLGWMGDRSIPECQRLGFAQGIVEVARQDEAMADEVYVQVMKQLTRNPSERSILNGWKLMLLLCQQVTPSTDLEEFVRSFIIASLKPNQEAGLLEAVAIAKQCKTELNILITEHHPGAGAEGEEEQEKPIPVQVLLIDNSIRKVFIKPSSTLEQVGQTVAAQLKVHRHADFSFFQVTDGLETHRLLPESTVVSKLLEKWDKLQACTQRQSRLLWKRRFLRVDEALQTGDMQHAILTYRQALWDYIHYPISEEIERICNLAGLVLCIERSHYEKHVRDGTLTEAGVLEMLLPKHLLHFKKRHVWARMVTDSYNELTEQLVHKEAKIQQMGRFLAECQRMKLFGVYHWLGRQIAEVPAGKESIPKKPGMQTCKINPKEPEDEYWVCVDLFGVRFVSVDSAPGFEFQRGFLFNEEAVERVLRWGANKNVVEFVVQTVNPAFPTQGRVPMIIALQCPAAVDIAYAIHCIQNEKGKNA